MLVYVINRNGNKLMPCKPSKARKLLRDGKAKVIKKYTDNELKKIKNMIHIDTSSKLNEDDIKEIKRLLNSNCPVKQIAIKFNVTRQTIYDIKNFKYWSNIN